MDALSEDLDTTEKSFTSKEWAVSSKEREYFLNEAFKGSSSRGHKLSKEPTMIAVPHVVSAAGEWITAIPDDIEHQSKQWGGLWIARNTPQERFRPTHSHPLSRPSATLAASLAIQFALGTAIIDGWHPAILGLLPEQQVDKLIDILMLVEELGAFPDQQVAFLMRLIPKPTSGVRSVALFRSLFRFWGKLRTPILRTWQRQCAQYAAFGMSQGRKASDAVFRSLTRALLGREQGSFTAELQWDIKKFFDHVCQWTLMEIAVAVQYPTALLTVSLNTYRAPRRLQLDLNTVSPVMYATRCVTAGGPHASYEVTAYFVMAVRTYEQLHPQVPLGIHVDDLSAAATRRSEIEAAQALEEAAQTLIEEVGHKLKLPFEPDKAYVLGTTDRTTALAYYALGRHAGSKVAAVKKLGCDYSLRHRDPKGGKLLVLKQRMKKAIDRGKRVAKIAGKRNYSTVFQAGIKQEALFGSDLSRPDPRLTHTLRQQALSAAKWKLAGVAIDLRMLAAGPKLDPQLDIICRAIGTWSREWWLSSGKEPHRPGDVLSPKELAQAHRLAPPLLDGSVPFSKAWKDPVANFRWALSLLGWQWYSPTFLLMHNRTQVSMNVTSSSMILRLARSRWRDVLGARVSDKVFAGKPWAHHTFATMCSSNARSGLSAPQKKLLTRYLAGNVLTRQVLGKWGYKVDLQCPFCQEPDTAFHRVWSCPVHSELRLQVFPKEWVDSADPESLFHSRALFGFSPGVDSHPVPQQLQLFAEVDGVSISIDQFPGFDLRLGPVYSDGSAFHSNSPLASAGFAVCQIRDGKVIRLIWGRVPAPLPQISDVAEHLAAMVAAQYTANGPIELVTDCASVVSAFSEGPELATSHKRPHAGYWSNISEHAFGDVLKVKAHLSLRQAQVTGQERFWKGNELVDLEAKRAASHLAPPVDKVKLYAEQTGRAVRLFKGVATMLDKWPEFPFELKKIERSKQPTRPAKQKDSLAHSFSWDSHLSRWRCELCGVQKRTQKHRIDKTPCPGRSRVMHSSKIHASHKLWVAPLLDGSHWPLLYCNLCGAHSSVRLQNLTHSCLGELAVGKTRLLSRLRFGLHPSRNIRLGKPYRFRPAAQVQDPDRLVIDPCPTHLHDDVQEDPAFLPFSPESQSLSDDWGLQELADFFGEV